MFLLGENWYQILIQGGSKIPESPPNAVGSCGTDSPGWMDDQHPTVVGQTKSVKYCFQSAFFGYCLLGKVTNCGGSFSYYLPETKDGTARSRYCFE